MDIAIDFDGTCVTHEYPAVGKNIGAEIVLKMLSENGHNLILFTMRCDVEGYEDGGVFTGPKTRLQDAVEWFADQNIPLYGIQFNPSQNEWTQSNKCYAQLYIDDAALGCPLISNLDYSGRPYVDWLEVYHYFIEKGVLKYWEDQWHQISEATNASKLRTYAPLINRLQKPGDEWKPKIDGSRRA